MSSHTRPDHWVYVGYEPPLALNRKPSRYKERYTVSVPLQVTLAVVVSILVVVWFTPFYIVANDGLDRGNALAQATVGLTIGQLVVTVFAVIAYYVGVVRGSTRGVALAPYLLVFLVSVAQATLMSLSTSFWWDTVGSAGIAFFVMQYLFLGASILMFMWFVVALFDTLDTQ